MTIARFQNLHFSYSNERPVFKDLTLTIEEGGFYFLTGASGSGKSTFLKLLHLSNMPSLGTLELFGKDTKSLSSQERAQMRQRMGYIFQDFKLMPHLTVLENIILPLHVRGHDPKEALKNGMELIEWLSLKGYENQLPDTLSGGQQQRIAIGRALITRPSLILADEPTGNIDEKVGRSIVQVLKDLNSLGATVIMATHNMTYTRENDYPIITIDPPHAILTPAQKKETSPKKDARHVS